MVGVSVDASEANFPRMQIAGSKILVTAGARRLGAHVAIGLAERGADVAITYYSSEAHALETVAAIEAHGRRGLAAFADLSRPAEAIAAVHEAHEGLGGLDAVVHAASGGFVPTPFGDVTPEQFEEAIGATLRGGFFISQAAAKLLPPGGAIVLIGDIAGIAGWPAFLAHSCAKGALRTLVRGLGRTLGLQGIRVSLIHPGAVLLPDGMTGEDEGRFAARVPLGHVGSPDDILGGIAFLLEASYVTGTELVVDGGRLVSG